MTPIETDTTAVEQAQAKGVCPWVAPSDGDSRSPCPALNSLANHGYL
jgi:hypothetical protein